MHLQNATEEQGRALIVERVSASIAERTIFATLRSTIGAVWQTLGGTENATAS
jgi:hypothetical protein